VYNGAGYLRESLDSILAQTYKRLEVIVLDDASTDDTPGIIASYGSRLTCVRHQTNLGQFQNVNSGIARASGEFVAIFHADDVYEPTIIQREVEFLLAHGDVGAVFSLDKFIDAAGREYGRLVLPVEVRGKEVLQYRDVLEVMLLRKNIVLRTPGAMVRRRIYDEVGLFDPSYAIGADFELWLRIARAHAIGLLNEHLFSYRHFHGNLSHHYRHLRTTPDVFFRIMDEHLAGRGRTLVSPRALAAFEGHRAEETLMNAVSHYIAGDMTAVRRTIAPLRSRTILGGITIQRGRMLALLWLLRVLSRVPHIAAIGRAFRRRWYATAPVLART
jgi:glycosyltransferase involved in cell wall biosynthesis